MNKKSQLQFAHRCAILLESGISLSEALTLIINLEKSTKGKHILCTIKENVEKGISLSKSIHTSKARFDPTLFSMISFGEKSGILAPSLRQALEILEKGGQIHKKLVGALIYPGFIALATLGMSLFLVMYIFPKIIPLFSSMDITLPLLTRAVRWLYESALHYGFWILANSALLTILFSILYKKKKRFRSQVQVLLLLTPGLGTIFKKYFISTFCRTTGTLLECGQTLPSILSQISESATFGVYRRAWKIAQKEIERGIPLSTSLRLFKSLFPELVPDMLSIGERTGSLASMFSHISKMYEEEIEEFIQQLGTIIEPVLMIIMGLVVGSVALSIILPIYEVTNHLTH